MTTTSGNPTTSASSVSTPQDLAGLPDDAFREGDMASVASLWPGSSFRLRRTAASGPVDNVNSISTHSGNGYWEVFGTGLSSTPEVFADLAALGVYQESLDDGAIVYVQSVRSYYQKVFGANAPIDAITSIANAMGDATWRRLPVRSPSWRAQASWYIDGANGDDENIGSALSPIKTFAELTRRVLNVDLLTTVTLVGDTIGPIEGTFIGRSTVAEVKITGVPTVLASGATTVFTGINEAGNLRATVTCAEIGDLTPYIGKLIRSTALENVTALLAVVGGVGQVGGWCRLTATSYSVTIPVNGTTLQVLEIPDCPSVKLSFYCGAKYKLLYLRFQTPPEIVSRQYPFVHYLFANEHSGEIGSKLQTNLFMCGSLLTGPTFKFIGRNVGLSTISTSALNARVEVTSGFRTSFYLFFVQGGTGIVIDGSSPSGEDAPFSRAWITSSAIGAFDVQGDALTVTNGAILSGGGRFFGSGNTGYALVVKNGGKVVLQTQTFYTLGGAGQISLSGSANAISPLVAGANVPATSALTTWAQWGAAPFSRKAIDYTNLSAFLGF